MNSVIADLRYAGRELRRRPGFAITAVLSLALGIGATSAVFSVIYGVLLNPFPYVQSERMMQLALRDEAGRLRYPGMTGVQLEQLRQARTIESVVAEDGWNLTTTDGDIPEDVVAAYISPNAPNHWGSRALMGRWLIPADAPQGRDAERVVVLGYQFWQRYYAGDPGVVGRTIELVRKNYQIVGVMPPRFRWREADIYVPLAVRSEPNIYYGVNIRIKPGVSIADANADLQPIVQQFAKDSPGRYPDSFRVNLRSIVELYARPMGPKLLLLLGAVASLLLVGCANVSILLLVRGAHRQQELAVRAALGAGRGRIVRQLLTEAVAMAIAGTAFGVLIAWKGLALIVSWIPTNSFAAESVIEMNLPVLLVSTALAVVTAVVFGVWPALQLSRPDLARVTPASARRVLRVRDLNGWITNLQEYAQQKLVARLFGIFSLLALALSAVGLYSVVSYGVATRTNEFGIRMALGARAQDVVRMVLSGTFWNVAAGLAAGVILCLLVDRLAAQWVAESSKDPLILSGVTVLLLAVAVLACLAPARRAASIDPMDAVRHE